MRHIDRSQMRMVINGQEVRPRVDSPGSPGSGHDWPHTTRISPPFEQQTFLDLENRQRIGVLTVKNDSTTQVYRSEKPMPEATDWQITSKTKKIAGYTCQKATATRRKQSYAI